MGPPAGLDLGCRATVYIEGARPLIELPDGAETTDADLEKPAGMFGQRMNGVVAPRSGYAAARYVRGGFGFRCEGSRVAAVKILDEKSFSDAVFIRASVIRQ